MDEKAKEARRAYKKELTRTGAKKKKTAATVDSMSEQAREARRAYKREWNRKNKDKVKAANERYWNRKAAAITAAAQDQPGSPATLEG